MSTWKKYTDYVDKYFRYMPCGSHAIGSVAIAWDDEGQPIKFCAVNMRVYPKQDTKRKLKFAIAEKLPAFWAQIPEERKI